MAKRKIDENIRERLQEITGAPGYNACMAEELLVQVRDDLVIPDEDLGYPERFFDTLEQMYNDHELGISGRGNVIGAAQLGYVTGIFRGNAKGFGFLTPDPAFTNKYPEDLYIGRESTGGAMNGDRVTVRVNTRDARRGQGGRPSEQRSAEGSVVRINERALKTVIGTLQCEIPFHKRGAKRWYIEPDDRKLSLEVLLNAQEIGDAKEGDKVEAEITRYPKPENPDAAGKIIHIFGDAQSKQANYDVILHENHIRTEFPPEVLSDADTQAARTLTLDGRLDLRDKIIFTIDGADSKDLDDAISLEKQGDGWLLGVHIADVSEYVRERSPLDSEALSRGTSVYFADQVVPMLPRALSNGICSLNGGEDRYALSALISLDAHGAITGCELHETMINSKVRGVYSELNDILEKGTDSVFYEKYKILFPDIYPEMVRLYEILYKKNRAKGALELETAEAKIIVNEEGMPVDIVKRERGISECLIEQFMLCANEAVASWLYNMQMPCVYRVHEEPPEDKMQTFSAFAYNLGLDIRPLKHKTLRPMDLQTIMNEAKEKGLDGVLSTVMLRSLSKAKYSRTQGIHFGLATDFYCHFTSPIRRYPDLTVHRFVKNVLHGHADEEAVRRMDAFAEKSAVQSSECEIHAMTAERAIEDLYKVIFMEDHLDEEFDGIISSVTSFGFFVELENTCEGLVPITSLPGFFNFDEKNLTLSCGRTMYRLGQKVRVRLTRADRVMRKLDMELAGENRIRESGGRYERTFHAETRQTGHRRGKVR